MTFPSSPTNGQTTVEFGKTFVYSSASATWMPVSSPSTPTVRESIPTPIVVSTSLDLPMIGNTAGRTGYVSDTNRLYIWNGTGWFQIALINTNPTITDGGQATYELNIDGTPTIITLVANDPEGLPLTWSYVVSSGSLEDTTVTNEGAVFTITPGEIAATFNLTFTASDGINIDTSVSSFTLSFVDWTTATLLHTLNNPNPYGTSYFDIFGISVSVSGDYGIVGASFEDDPSSIQSGKAYIFNVTTGALVHTLDNPNPSSNTQDDGDKFGNSVAISGNYAIIGAPYEDINDGSLRLESGRAYIFNVTTGALVYTLDNPNFSGTRANDRFGYSVAITSNYCIVGAVGESPVDGGAAYIFDVTTGALLYTLENPNAYGTTAGDYFGNSVAISGNYAIVGANAEDDASGTGSGKAYIFDATTGALVHTLDNPNPDNTGLNDSFGGAVAMDGNYAIIGAHGEDVDGGGSGNAYIFDVATGALLFTLDNPNAASTPTSDRFGEAVGISGDFAIVGANAEDAVGAGSGTVYIFNVTTGSLLKTFNDPNAYSSGAGDAFGYSVSISGGYALASAAYEADAGGGYSGKAYIFQAG
jgi:hypothetical protein